MIDDIRSFAPKFMGPFTKRQTLSVACSVPFFFLGFGISMLLHFPVDKAILVAVVCAGIIASCGWVEISNIPLEIYVIKYFYRTILTPTIRRYKTEIPLKAELEKIQKEKEQKYIKTLSKKELKAYEKEKKKKKNVNYGSTKFYS